METQNPYNRGLQQPAQPSASPKKKFNGRAFAGLVVVIVGSALFVKQLGIPMPHWIFTWPMILIAIGTFTGINSGFKGISWLVLILIGGVFLVDKMIYDIDIHRFFWPVFIIGIGIYMILKPKKKDGFWEDEALFGSSNSSAGENFFDATAIFGGVKKNIISKDFKGGDVTSMFGGSEIVLTQADINGTAVIDVTTIFGGSKIIVPSNWTVKSDDLTAILGGFEDKRAIMANANPDPNKVLILRGTVMFGGIELKSF
jgi:predicted membrane protein